MGNKPIGTKSDPLVLVPFKILKSQKDFLDNIGEPASAFIRKLISAQMSGHEAEISKLKEELRQHEAHINIINAQISELEVADQRKQKASQTREQLLDQVTERLIKCTQIIDFKDRQFIRIFETNLKDTNRKLNGNGEPITPEELRILTIKKAEAREMAVL